MKTYTITFKASLTEDDVKAMKGCFYQTMNESMEISEVWGLEIKEDEGFDEEPDIKDAQKYTMHWDDVVYELRACKTIDEVKDFLDTIPRKFGEWWVDKVGGYYEVTNEWWDEQREEPGIVTFALDIKVED